MLPPLRAAAGLPGKVEQCRWNLSPIPVPVPIPVAVLRTGLPKLVSLRLRRRVGGGPRRSTPAGGRRAPRARCRCSFRAWALMPAGNWGGGGGGGKEGMRREKSGVQTSPPRRDPPPRRRSNPRLEGCCSVGEGMERLKAPPQPPGAGPLPGPMSPGFFTLPKG